MAALRRIAADSEKLSEVLADLDEGLAHPNAAHIRRIVVWEKPAFRPEWLLRLLKRVKARQPHIRQIAFTETL